MTSRANRETRTYGTPIRPAIRTGPPAKRNVVGEADPATRRRMLDQQLNPPASTRPAPRPAAPTTGNSPDALKLQRAERDLRFRSRSLDKEIEDRS